MKRIEVSKTSSKGIVMGNVFVAREQDLSPEEKVIEVGQADAEKAAYERAVEEVIADLEPLAEKSDIFAGHLNSA